MNRPAGWYRNLDDRRQHGYWNGEAWVDPDDLASPADVLDEIEEGHEIETTVVVEEPQTGHGGRPDDAPDRGRPLSKPYGQRRPAKS